MTVTAGSARALIRTHTALAADTLTELGRGVDSVAFLADGAWVCRFAVTPNARRTLRRELALLPRLGRALSVAIPDFEQVARDGDRLLFAAYRALPGQRLTPEAFAALGPAGRETALAGLAGFLRALHAYPVATAREAGVGEQLDTGGYHRAQRDLPELLGGVLPAADRARIGALLERFERDHPPDRVPAVLLHADLKPEHVLHDPAGGRLTGVLDWGDVSLGDGDFDLAIVALFFGDGLLEALLDHLPGRDPEVVRDKARFFAVLRTLQDMHYVAARDGDAAARRLLPVLRRALERCGG